MHVSIKSAGNENGWKRTEEEQKARQKRSEIMIPCMICIYLYKYLYIYNVKSWRSFLHFFDHLHKIKVYYFHWPRRQDDLWSLLEDHLMIRESDSSWERPPRRWPDGRACEGAGGAGGTSSSLKKNTIAFRSSWKMAAWETTFWGKRRIF